MSLPARYASLLLGSVQELTPVGRILAYCRIGVDLLQVVKPGDGVLAVRILVEDDGLPGLVAELAAPEQDVVLDDRLAVTRAVDRHPPAPRLLGGVGGLDQPFEQLVEVREVLARVDPDRLEGVLAEEVAARPAEVVDGVVLAVDERQRLASREDLAEVLDDLVLDLVDVFEDVEEPQGRGRLGVGQDVWRIAGLDGGGQLLGDVRRPRERRDRREVERVVHHRRELADLLLDVDVVVRVEVGVDDDRELAVDLDLVEGRGRRRGPAGGGRGRSLSGRLGGGRGARRAPPGRRQRPATRRQQGWRRRPARRASGPRSAWSRPACSWRPGRQAQPHHRPRRSAAPPRRGPAAASSAATGDERPPGRKNCTILSLTRHLLERN